MSHTQWGKIKLGVSRCLLGDKVRFDGGHKKNAYIKGVLSEYFEFVTFCPEVEIGLDVPREPLRLEVKNQQVRCVACNNPHQDVTERLYQLADQHRARHSELCGYIVKNRSPSCGMLSVELYHGDAPPSLVGRGLYTERLIQHFPYLPVEEAERLEDPSLRENFIQRVYIYSRWLALLQNHLSVTGLQSFHARHKFIFMSHDPVQAKQLGSILGNVSTQLSSEKLQQLSQHYAERMSRLLQVVATRNNHVNTLQHIQGYLKNHLSHADKQELLELFEQYQHARLPLIVPISLLRHHFRRYPNEYISSSYYLYPHPGELILLNSV